MCGSGTFLIEAALMATDTAPGAFRRWWPFQQWADAYDAGAWKVGWAQGDGRQAPALPLASSLHVCCQQLSWHT